MVIWESKNEWLGGWRGVTDFWSTGRGDVKARVYESRISFFSSSLYFCCFTWWSPCLPLNTKRRVGWKGGTDWPRADWNVPGIVANLATGPMPLREACTNLRLE